MTNAISSAFLRGLTSHVSSFGGSMIRGGGMASSGSSDGYGEKSSFAGMAKSELS